MGALRKKVVILTTIQSAHLRLIVCSVLGIPFVFLGKPVMGWGDGVGYWLFFPPFSCWLAYTEPLALPQVYGWYMF